MRKDMNIQKKDAKGDAVMEKAYVDDRKLKEIGDFFKEEDGMGTVEIILIIVVLIGLVIIFKNQLRTLVNNVFQHITKDSNTVMQ